MKFWRGFSIVEMIVVIAIVAILIVAMTMLVGRFFTVSRSQFEQTRTTEDARIQLERLVDTVRNAHFLDCDANGTPDKPEEWWLQAADSTHVVFYSNIDADTATERITYEQTGNDLVRTVDQNTTTPCSFTPGSPQAVAHSLYNTPVQPLFEYIAQDGTTVSGPSGTHTVARVRVQLIIDANGQTVGNAASLVTEITPRLGQPAVADSPTQEPTPAPPGSPSSLSLHVTTSSIKAAPELSPTGPVMLDLGELWGVTLTQNGTDISPYDSGLGFALLPDTTGAVEIRRDPPGGIGDPLRLFGARVGTAKVTAIYNGATLTFDVIVRDGCWGTVNGEWVAPKPLSTVDSFIGPIQSMAFVCQQAGYSGQPACGRICSDAAPPGADSHFTAENTANWQQHVKPCGTVVPGFTNYVELYCVPPSSPVAPGR